MVLVFIPGMLFAPFYTQIFARNVLGEVAAGLGSLPVIGAYLVQTQDLSLPLILLAFASGILTFNLLLINEFPDVEADRNGGRRTGHIVGQQESSLALPGWEGRERIKLTSRSSWSSRYYSSSDSWSLSRSDR
jgi:1,4-dihydroxy-2-naphthoate octaprenyltransferase